MTPMARQAADLTEGTSSYSATEIYYNKRNFQSYALNQKQGYKTRMCHIKIYQWRKNELLLFLDQGEEYRGGYTRKTCNWCSSHLAQKNLRGGSCQKNI